MNASTSAPGSSGAADGQLRQQLAGHGVQLPHVAPGERAQERPQRGRCPDPAEQVRHRAVPQHVHVIDAVRPGGHPRDQAGHLQVRVHPGPAGDRDVLADQVRQAAALRQGHDRDQAGPRHEIRVIKRCVRLQRIMRQSHLRGVLSAAVHGSFSNSHCPSSEGTFRVDHAQMHPYLRGGSRLRQRPPATIGSSLVVAQQFGHDIFVGPCAGTPSGDRTAIRRAGCRAAAAAAINEYDKCMKRITVSLPDELAEKVGAPRGRAPG